MSEQVKDLPECIDIKHTVKEYEYQNMSKEDFEKMKQFIETIKSDLLNFETRNEIKLETIKNQIADGNYVVDCERIATLLVNKEEQD